MNDESDEIEKPWDIDGPEGERSPQALADPFAIDGPGGEPTSWDHMLVLENIPPEGIPVDELVERVDENEGLIDSVINELKESDQIRVTGDRIFKR